MDPTTSLSPSPDAARETPRRGRARPFVQAVVMATVFVTATFATLGAAPADETNEEKITRLEREKKNLNVEVKRLEIALDSKKKQLANKIRPSLPAATGFYVEGGAPASARFTFTSRHAGKDIKGTVDAKPPVAGKTAPAVITAKQTGKK